MPNSGRLLRSKRKLKPAPLHLLRNADSHYSTRCHTHVSSRTLHIGAHLDEPRTQTRIHELINALTSAADGRSYTRCATESAARTITAYLRDLRAAKKNGQWSSEEKKALKAESKAVIKEMKKDLKNVWKDK